MNPSAAPGRISVSKVTGPGGTQLPVQSITTRDNRAHDLAYTESSTHCRSCGFETYWTYPKNHSALKCAEVMRDVVDKIKVLYPLAW